MLGVKRYMPVEIMLLILLLGFSTILITWSPSVLTTPYFDGMSDDVTTTALPPLFFRRSWTV